MLTGPVDAIVRFVPRSHRRADKRTPLNQWVQWPVKYREGAPLTCPTKLSVTARDMSDGDEKTVTIAGTAVTITPANNNQSWKVDAVLDPKTCSAVIDFGVPGKPNPPPCKLVATLWRLRSTADTKHAYEFTDPTNACQFGEPGSPLNEWVAVATEIALAVTGTAAVP